MEERKRKHGDRRDGWRVEEKDPLHMLVPYMLPGRCANEGVMNYQVDLTAAEAYLKKKNDENPQFKYTLFHLILAALSKTIYMRPIMNRFIIGKRLYDRNNISFSFVVKHKFADNDEEALVIMKVDQEKESSLLDQCHDRVCSEVYKVREEHVEDGSTSMMKIFNHLPGGLLTFALWVIRKMDDHGHMPRVLEKIDPYRSTAFVSNLGSIKMSADYHHLTEWGTNSVFVIIGEKSLRPYFDAEGHVDMRMALDLGITVDERIGDGFYFARSIKLLNAIMQHPEELDKPLRAEFPCEWR